MLKIDTNDTSNSDYVTGNLSWLTLSTPRLGASAAWVDARGLVIAGGDQPAASGSPAAAGVEIIANGQTTGTQLPYPPDYSMGSGMTTLDDAEYVLLAGGTLPSGADPGVRDIDLGCAVNCQGASWGSPAGRDHRGFRVHVRARPTRSSSAASPPSGLTHTFTLTSAGPTEVPTKVPHTNASSVISPMLSSILVFGGSAGGEIESFTPAASPQ